MKYFRQQNYFGWILMQLYTLKMSIYYSCPLMPMGLKECLIKSYQNWLLTCHELSYFCILNFRKSEVIEFEDMKLIMIRKIYRVIHRNRFYNPLRHQHKRLIEINLDVLCIHNKIQQDVLHLWVICSKFTSRTGPNILQVQEDLKLNLHSCIWCRDL